MERRYIRHGRLGDSVKVLEGCGLDSRRIGERITFEKYKELGGDMNDFLLWRTNLDHARKTIVFIKPSKGKPFIAFKHSVKKV